MSIFQNPFVPRGAIVPGGTTPNPLYPGMPTTQIPPGYSGAIGYRASANGGPILVPLQSADRAYSLKAEDRSEPVVGWRRYHLMEDNNQLILRGQRIVWPEPQMDAICGMDTDVMIFEQLTAMFGDKGAEVFNAYVSQRKDSPKAGHVLCEEHIRDGFCQCGIYGGSTPDHTMGGGEVMAKCLAWGYVAMDSDGNWKASAVRIEALFVQRTLLRFYRWLDWASLTRGLRERYGCPVFLVLDMDDIPR